MDARRLSLCLLLLASCGGRAALPGPSTPLAATPADAIPEPPTDVADAPIALDLRESQLDNGMRVVVSPRPAEGLATVVLLDAAAAGRDARSTRALTEVMAYAMLDATQTDAGVVPDYARHRGFDLSVGLRARALVAGATLRSRQLEEFLGVLDEVVRRPAFRTDRIRQVLMRRLETIDGELATAEGILDDRLPSLLYGPHDPRAAPLLRMRGELAQVTPEALVARHQQVLDPSQCTLLIVGQVDPEAAAQAAARVFGAWPANPSPPELTPVEYAGGDVRGVGVVRPLLRPWIGVLERAPPLGHADHAAFLVLAQVLGAMFSSRLNLLVRESEQASYGLGASYEARPDGGELRVVTAIDPREVARFLGTLRQELSRVRGEGGGLETRELAIARTRARQMLRAQLDTTSGVASALASYALAGLPLQGTTEVLRRVERLSATDIQAAARRWIRPDRAPIGVVAARGIFEQQVAQVPLGRFELIVPPPRVRR